MIDLKIAKPAKRAPKARAAAFKAGFARADITPPLGTPIVGYFERRVAFVDCVAPYVYASAADDDRVAALIEEGLVDYIAMDIKNCREKYPITVGVADFDIAAIDESIRLLKTSGVAHEFRTTVVRELHTVEDIADIAKWLGGGERLFLQQFVDSGDLIGEGMSPHDPATLHAMRDAAAQ